MERGKQTKTGTENKKEREREMDGRAENGRDKKEWETENNRNKNSHLFLLPKPARLYSPVQIQLTYLYPYLCFFTVITCITIYYYLNVVDVVKLTVLWYDSCVSNQTAVWENAMRLKKKVCAQAINFKI